MLPVNMTGLSRQRHREPAADASLITALLSSSPCVQLTNHYKSDTETDHPCSKGLPCTIAELIIQPYWPTLHNKLYGNPAVYFFYIVFISLYATLWVLITRCYIHPCILRDVNVSRATSIHRTKTCCCLWALFIIFDLENIFRGLII